MIVEIGEHVICVHSTVFFFLSHPKETLERGVCNICTAVEYRQVKSRLSCI